MSFRTGRAWAGSAGYKTERSVEATRWASWPGIWGKQMRELPEGGDRPLKPCPGLALSRHYLVGANSTAICTFPFPWRCSICSYWLSEEVMYAWVTYACHVAKGELAKKAGH